jgi:two-component system chemotaxis response regulator CheY
MTAANILVTMKVLIAEDTESVRCALRLAVEHLGHEVVGLAADGADALAQYQSKHPELVLMDVKMPRMDGLTCTTLLSQQDPKAKVVIVTGGRTSEREARQAGARGYVEKPFDIWQLDQVMHSLAHA